MWAAVPITPGGEERGEVGNEIMVGVCTYREQGYVSKRVLAREQPVWCSRDLGRRTIGNGIGIVEQGGADGDGTVIAMKTHNAN